MLNGKEFIQFLCEGRAVSWQMDNETKENIFSKNGKCVLLTLKELTVRANVSEKELAKEWNIKNRSCQEENRPGVKNHKKI